MPAGNAAFREFCICGMCDAWAKAHPAPPAKPARRFRLLIGGQYHMRPPVKKRPSPK